VAFSTSYARLCVLCFLVGATPTVLDNDPLDDAAFPYARGLCILPRSIGAWHHVCKQHPPQQHQHIQQHLCLRHDGNQQRHPHQPVRPFPSTVLNFSPSQMTMVKTPAPTPAVLPTAQAPRGSDSNGPSYASARGTDSRGLSYSTGLWRSPRAPPVTKYPPCA